MIRDFAILIGTAGAAGLIFYFLRLPLLLGYILSGFIVGPHFLFSPYIQNYEVLQQFGDLGVIFLMFYIGLEFDLDKLRRTMGPSFLAVLFQTVIMMFVGILSARCLGWQGINGLFLGALMAISSTMMTIPVLKEENALNTHYAQLAIGILVLEDFVAILLLVILSGISMKGHFEWKAVEQVTFLLGVFVVMVFVLGRFCGARLSKWLSKITSPDLLVLIPIGFALAIGELANEVHFSTELGAFLAGSVLSQTAFAHKIDAITEPLRNMFCAIFFVTIGMAIDPTQIAQHWVAILVISIIATIAQIFVCWFGLYLAGEDSKVSFYTSVYKSQKGEFSFVIAGLGASLGVTDPALMSIAVGLSLCTIVLSSLLRKYIEPLYTLIARCMPKSLVNFGQFYRQFQQVAKLEIEKMTFLHEAKGYILSLVWYFLMLVGLMILAGFFSQGVENKTWPFIAHHEVIAMAIIWISAAFIIMPIFAGVVKNINAIINIVLNNIFHSEQQAQEQENSRSIGVIRHVVLSIVLLFIGIIFVSVSSAYLPTGYPLTVFALCSIGQAAFGWRELLKSNSRFEKSFRETFMAEVQEKDDEYRNAVMQRAREKYPWTAQIQNYRLPKNSVAIGRKISSLQLREKTGTTIVAVSRSGYTCYSPSPDAILFPDDQLLLLGEASQIQAATDFFNEEAAESVVSANRVEFAIDNYCVTPMSPFLGKAIAMTGIRSQYGVNIAGIQRLGEKITVPKPSFVLEKDDILILTGPKSAIEKLKQSELTPRA